MRIYAIFDGEVFRPEEPSSLEANKGGSHVIFSASHVREIVSVPAKRPIKPVYIKKFLALIDAAGAIGTK
jgi:hypothetical protein